MRQTTRGARPERHPITSLLLPVPIVCFVGALITDLAYRGSGGNLLWLNFSSWLIAAGLLFGGIAAVVLIVELLVYPLLRRTTGWWHIAASRSPRGSSNSSMRSSMHATAGPRSFPPGLLLSIVGALLILISGGCSPLWRLGQSEHDAPASRRGGSHRAGGLRQPSRTSIPRSRSDRTRCYPNPRRG